MRSKDRGLMERIQTFAEDYALAHHGKTPNIREIGAAVGVSHITAYRYLVEMDELGMVDYSRGEIHTELIDKIEAGRKMMAVAVSIPCGTPDEQQEMIEEFVSVPSIFLGNHKGEFFILRTVGDSMIDAGIDEGDYVILKKQIEARDGDIVAALVENHESTLKRFRTDEAGAYLWAENDSWNDSARRIKGTFEIQGVAIKVVKDL